jgi:hypothetical protein
MFKLDEGYGNEVVQSPRMICSKDLRREWYDHNNIRYFVGDVIEYVMDEPDKVLGICYLILPFIVISWSYYVFRYLQSGKETGENLLCFKD